MASEKRGGFITGMTGVYQVAAELSSKGFILTTTSRNAPGVDIIATTPDLGKAFSIQVKSNKPEGTHSYWILASKEGTLTKSDWKPPASPSLFYVFVNLKEHGKSDFYVVRSEVVVDNLDVDHNKGRTWFTFARDEDHKEKWEILG